ncbi:hypothetical protein V9K67_22025 [Paraflavisolibacter sp. H34]|uniref:hypothetical protein n=1 Tax=Huijunlia imazamoxiresistens TaxID=3127457 RepID=UPI00301AF79C
MGIKISYKTHPVLNLLNSPRDKRTFYVLPQKFSKYLRAKPDIYTSLDLYGGLFRSNIQLITKPFSDALLENFDKFQIEEVIHSLENLSGCMIFPNQYSYLYNIQNYHQGVIFCFIKEALAYYANFRDGHNVICDLLVPNGFVSEQEILQNFDMVSNLLMTTLAFIRYTEVEVKELPAQKKVHEFDCKYVNDTSFDMHIYDCRWYTTYVKTEGFPVRGHLRHQPKKEKGEWTKKYIWIEPFMKTGYTLKAGVLKAAEIK